MASLKAGGGGAGGAAPDDRIIIGHGTFSGEQFPLLEGYTVYTLCKSGYPILTGAVSIINKLYLDGYTMEDVIKGDVPGIVQALTDRLLWWPGAYGEEGSQDIITIHKHVGKGGGPESVGGDEDLGEPYWMGDIDLDLTTPTYINENFWTESGVQRMQTYASRWLIPPLGVYNLPIEFPSESTRNEADALDDDDNPYYSATIAGKRERMNIMFHPLRQNWKGKLSELLYGKRGVSTLTTGDGLSNDAGLGPGTYILYSCRWAFKYPYTPGSLQRGLMQRDAEGVSRPVPGSDKKLEGIIGGPKYIKLQRAVSAEHGGGGTGYPTEDTPLSKEYIENCHSLLKKYYTKSGLANYSEGQRAILAHCKKILDNRRDYLQREEAAGGGGGGDEHVETDGEGYALDIYNFDKMVMVAGDEAAAVADESSDEFGPFGRRPVWGLPPRDGGGGELLPIIQVNVPSKEEPLSVPPPRPVYRRMTAQTFVLSQEDLGGGYRRHTKRRKYRRRRRKRRKRRKTKRKHKKKKRKTRRRH